MDTEKLATYEQRRIFTQWLYNIISFAYDVIKNVFVYLCTVQSTKIFVSGWVFVGMVLE